MPLRPYAFETEYQGHSGKVLIKPWHPSHPIRKTVSGGNPIVAEEAQHLFEEIDRLHALERRMHDYFAITARAEEQRRQRSAEVGVPLIETPVLGEVT